MLAIFEFNNIKTNLSLFCETSLGPPSLQHQLLVINKWKVWQTVLTTSSVSTVYVHESSRIPVYVRVHGYFWKCTDLCNMVQVISTYIRQTWNYTAVYHDQILPDLTFLMQW